jgi:hypothetical protein
VSQSDHGPKFVNRSDCQQSVPVPVIVVPTQQFIVDDAPCNSGRGVVRSFEKKMNMTQILRHYRCQRTKKSFVLFYAQRTYELDCLCLLVTNKSKFESEDNNVTITLLEFSALFFNRRTRW